MKYLLQIYQGDALEVQAGLSEADQQRVWADYAAVRETPGVTPAKGSGSPTRRRRCASRTGSH